MKRTARPQALPPSARSRVAELLEVLDRPVPIRGLKHTLRKNVVHKERKPLYSLRMDPDVLLALRRAARRRRSTATSVILTALRKELALELAHIERKRRSSDPGTAPAAQKPARSAKGAGTAP